MKINLRAFLIATATGFVVELLLGFAGAMINGRRTSGLFGPTQQDVAFGCFAGLIIIVLGLVTSGAVGAFYAWLSRNEPLLPRQAALGGALTAAAAAFCGKGLSVAVQVASVAATAGRHPGLTRGQTYAALAVGAILGIGVGVVVGGGMGALGAWITRRQVSKPSA